MLWTILIEKQTFKIGQNSSVEIPGLFRFCFDIFDMGDKEFICEHDIFQLLDLDLTLKGFSGE
jgi:hypothetical protein